MERYDTSRRTYSKRFYLSSIAASAIVPIILFAAVLVHPNKVFVGVDGDPQQTMWFVGWFWYAFLHGQSPFISHMANYPHGVNLMVNTSVPSESLLFGWLGLTASFAFAYNAMMFVNLVLTGFFGTLCFKEMRVTGWLCILGGITLQVIPYTSAQMMSHANLGVTFWIFAGFYVLLRFLNNRFQHAWAAGVVMGLLLAGEFYTSLEVFATLCMVIALGLLVGLILQYRKTWAALRRIPVSFWLTAVTVFLAFSLPGLFTFLYGPYRPSSGFLPQSFNNVFVNDMATFILPSPVYLLSPTYLSPHSLISSINTRLTGNFMEQDGYIGVFGIGLVVWAATRLWHRTVTKVLVVLLIFMAIMSMGTHLHILGQTTHFPLPWGAIARIPVLNQAIPARLMFYGDLIIVFLVFMGFENIARRRQDRRIRMNIRLTSLILIITWLPVLPYPTHNTPSVFAEVRSGGSLFTSLKGEPTLVLSDDYYDIGQALAEGGYAFPVASVYAFQSDTLAETAYRPLSYYGWPENLRGQQLIDYVESMLVSTKVRRVLLLPVGDVPAPSWLIDTLTQLCGSPKAEQGRLTYVWDVPQNLKAVWFTGDVANVQSIFANERSGKGTWVGRSWGVYTQGEGCQVTITAPSKERLANGVNLTLHGVENRSVRLGPGQRLRVVLRPNERLQVQSDVAFQVYNPMLDNNPKEYSVVVTVSLQ